MTHITPLRSAVSAIALLCATTASADVTAAEVWADWQESLAMYGNGDVTVGAEAMDGDTLTVSDIALAFEDETVKVAADVGDMQFQELGDGTVSITGAASFPMVITTDEGGDIKVTITQTGLKMIASGTAADLNYALSADQYAFNMDEVMVDGEKVEADIRFAMNDVTGGYTVKTGEMRDIAYSLDVASLDMLADIISPEIAGDYVTFSGKIQELSTTAEMTLALAENIESPEDMFASGFALDAAYEYTGGDYIFDVTSEGDQASGTASTGAGTLAMKMDASAMSYNSSVKDLEVALNGGSMPFPIEVSMAEYGFGVDMPVAKTKEPADFGLRVNLTDLAVNEAIWAMVDPADAIPHDPATILLDLSGKASLFFDLFDPAQAEAIAEADVPGELNALTLNDLQLKMAGVDVQGSGDFTFDNTDIVTFDGMPRPMGDATVNITGANALIDSLVQMGLLPEEQAMMGRMMMGMFAQSTGDDALTATLEINEEGHVIANGQRLQ